MKKEIITYADAIRLAMTRRMREDENVVLFGEDVGPFGGSFGLSMGMWEEFGELRVRDTPRSEGVIAGAAVGAAMTGIRPICEIMFMDFMTLAMDQMVNQAAQLRYMVNGNISVPMVIRMSLASGQNAAAQHSKSLEAWLTHTPGLKVVYPSTPEDAYGLLLAAIDDNGPVIYLENRALFGMKGEVDLDADPTPIGKAAVRKEGSDLTILCTGQMVQTSLDAAAELDKDGINAEVIDLRSLYPLDKDAIKESLSKTHRIIVTSNEAKRGSYAGEISAMIGEEFFDELDAPVGRICALDTPIPFSPVLENYVLPNAGDIVKAAKKMF